MTSASISVSGTWFQWFDYFYRDWQSLSAGVATWWTVYLPIVQSAYTQFIPTTPSYLSKIFSNVRLSENRNACWLYPFCFSRWACCHSEALQLSISFAPWFAGHRVILPEEYRPFSGGFSTWVIENSMQRIMDLLVLQPLGVLDNLHSTCRCGLWRYCHRTEKAFLRLVWSIPCILHVARLMKSLG